MDFYPYQHYVQALGLEHGGDLDFYEHLASNPKSQEDYNYVLDITKNMLNSTLDNTTSIDIRATVHLDGKQKDGICGLWVWTHMETILNGGYATLSDWTQERVSNYNRTILFRYLPRMYFNDIDFLKFMAPLFESWLDYLTYI